MQELLENCIKYFEEEAEKTLSENTLNAYRSDLKQFIEHLETKGIKEPIGITKEAVSDYRAVLEAKELTKTSINRKLTAISRFFFYLETTESFARPKIKFIKVQTQDFLPEMLTNNDVERVLRAVEKAQDLRTKAIILTLFYTGARISEALQISINDIDKDKVQIKGKGEKYRNLYIPKKLKTAWKEYAEKRLNTDDKALFTGDRGAITRATVNSNLKYYTGQARVKKAKVHPHAFRHLYTKNIWGIGLNPRAIGQLLGHEAKTTTDLYLSVSEKELLTAINKLDYKKGE